MLSDRSIAAEVVMQMVQRFRQLRDHEVVIYCSPRMRNWAVRPGYTCSPVGENAATEAGLIDVPASATSMSGRPSVVDTLKHLDRNYQSMQEKQYFVHTSNGFHAFTRRVAPMRRSLSWTRQTLLMPAKIRQRTELLEDGSWTCPSQTDGEGSRSAWGSFLMAAAEIEQAELNVAEQDLVDLMVREKNRQQNLRLDLVPQLLRLIHLQGATLVEEHVFLDEEAATPLVEVRRAKRREARLAKVANGRLVMELDWVAIADARALHQRADNPRRPLSEDERQRLDAAHVQQTFGDPDVWPLPSKALTDSVVLAYSDRKSQSVYRELCLLQGEDCVDTVLDALLARSADRSVQSFLEHTQHRPAIMRCLHNLVRAFGFQSIFDIGIIVVGDEQRIEIAAAYADFYTCIGDSNGQAVCVDATQLVAAASRVLRGHWFFAPVLVEQRSDQYMLRAYGAAISWPDFDCQRADRYRRSLQRLMEGCVSGDDSPPRDSTARGPARGNTHEGGASGSQMNLGSKGLRGSGGAAAGLMAALASVCEAARRAKDVSFKAKHPPAPNSHVEYVSRALADLHVRTVVVDLGVQAGPQPCTSACLWLSVAAGIRRHDPESIVDEVLRESLRPHLIAAASVLDEALHRASRHHPRTDAIGKLAHALRVYVCNAMLASPARWLPSFEVASLGAYNAKIRGMARDAFADHQMLLELAERLGVCIDVVPAVPAWSMTRVDPCHADLTKRVVLGNNDTHFVWLAPEPSPPLGMALGGSVVPQQAPQVGAHPPPESKRTKPAEERAKGRPDAGDNGGGQASQSTQGSSQGRPRSGGRTGDWDAQDDVVRKRFAAWYRGPRTNVGQPYTAGCSAGLSASSCNVAGPCAACRKHYSAKKQRDHPESPPPLGGAPDNDEIGPSPAKKARSTSATANALASPSGTASAHAAPMVSASSASGAPGASCGALGPAPEPPDGKRDAPALQCVACGSYTTSKKYCGGPQKGKLRWILDTVGAPWCWRCKQTPPPHLVFVPQR